MQSNRSEQPSCMHGTKLDKIGAKKSSPHLSCLPSPSATTSLSWPCSLFHSLCHTCHHSPCPSSLKSSRPKAMKTSTLPTVMTTDLFLHLRHAQNLVSLSKAAPILSLVPCLFTTIILTFLATPLATLMAVVLILSCNLPQILNTVHMSQFHLTLTLKLLNFNCKVKASS